MRSTEGGGEIGGVALQLASTATQAVSISLGSQAGKEFSIEGLLSEFVGAGLVGALLFQRLPGLALLCFAVVAKLLAHLGGISSRCHGLAPLDAGQRKSRR